MFVFGLVVILMRHGWVVLRGKFVISYFFLGGPKFRPDESDGFCDPGSTCVYSIGGVRLFWAWS